VEPAQALHHLDARPQRQVVEVGEEDLGAGGLELLRRDPLDRPEGADRQEGRRLDGAVRSGEPAAARRAAGRENLEGDA
jgi:hypothetical protein